MPITVNCTCGKVFNVRDEAAGTNVICQVCGQNVRAPLASVAQQVIAEAAAPLPPASAPSAMVPCPACAEEIPAESSFCPLCGEKLVSKIPKEELAAKLAERIGGLDAHINDLQEQLNDTKLRGSFLAIKTIVLGVFAALCAAMVIAGAASGDRDAGALVAMGIVFGLLFGIPTIVSLVNDYSASHIQDAKSPELAFRRFYTAVRTSRTGKAFASLLPAARQVGAVQTLKFHNSKIPPCTGTYAINDLASFKTYWKSIFSGPSLQSRTVQLKKVTTLRQGDGVAVIEAELEFTNYSSLILLTIFISLLITVVLILVLQQKETRKIRKLLVNRHGRWYLAEGELEGMLDQMKI